MKKLTLTEQKTNAREKYRAAATAWRETVTRENPKGDAALWRGCCNAKRDRMRLGVII